MAGLLIAATRASAHMARHERHRRTAGRWTASDPRPRAEGRPGSPLGTPARRAAMRLLLDAVLRRGGPLEAALNLATRALPGGPGALAHAIAAETLRRLPDLDALINSGDEAAPARRCQGPLRPAHRAGAGAGPRHPGPCRDLDPCLR
ncbi:hypothetical protein AB5I41_20875 [Sphingomonas sp. MMS24-JH45]